MSWFAWTRPDHLLTRHVTVILLYTADIKDILMVPDNDKLDKGLLCNGISEMPTMVSHSEDQFPSCLFYICVEMTQLLCDLVKECRSARFPRTKTCYSKFKTEILWI